MSRQWAINFLCRRRDLRRQSDAVAQLSPSQLLPVSVAALHSPVEVVEVAELSPRQLLPVSVAELHSPVGVVEVADLPPAKNDVPVLVLPSLPAAGLPVLRGSGLRPR